MICKKEMRACLLDRRYNVDTESVASVSHSFLTLSSPFNLKCFYDTPNQNISKPCHFGCVDFTIIGRSSVAKIMICSSAP